eukprot:6666043-Prymnesium_polylepis.1
MGCRVLYKVRVQKLHWQGPSIQPRGRSVCAPYCCAIPSKPVEIASVSIRACAMCRFARLLCALCFVGVGRIEEEEFGTHGQAYSGHPGSN